MLKMFKQVAVDAVKASKPATFLFGTVVSVAPLKIESDIGFTLGNAQLVVCDHLSVKHGTVMIGGSEYETTIDNSLKVNNKVILARVPGGQQFIVLDKVVST